MAQIKTNILQQNLFQKLHMYILIAPQEILDSLTSRSSIFDILPV